jgi:dipeptidyl aminopeptidase/acylaminoacyl peptidase
VRTPLAVAALALVCLLGLSAESASGSARYAGRDRYPLYAPDGKTLAFVRDGRIELVGADGEGLRALTPSQNPPWGLTWSPDGSALAYVSDGHIWRVDVAGGSPIQLTTTDGKSDMQPEWSPNGREIAFTRFERCWRCTTIYAIPATGGTPRMLVANGYDKHAVWSPDGSKFVTSDGDVRSAVDGRDLGRVLDGRAVGTAFDWGPHGIASVLGGFVYASQADSLATRRLGGDRHATATVSRWNRGGTRIAFGIDGSLAITDLRGRWRRLARASVANDAPSWAPNGTIAYVRADWCGIDTILADGTHHRRLTNIC